MQTILLTWNPAKWTWDDLPSAARRVLSGEQVKDRWSCGNRRGIAIGSRVFLLRQGNQGHRGIVGSGVTTGEPFEDRHFNPQLARQGKRTSYVEVRWDRLIDPDADPVLDRSLLDVPPLDQVNWSTQSSGIEIPPEAASALERLWSDHFGGIWNPATALDEDLGAMEGELRWQFVLHRRRERRLRDQKIADVLRRTGRLRCEVEGCGFDFCEVYGDLGKGYAQVHHTKPLGSRDGEERTTLDDLAVVCANCHAMIHVGGQCRPLHNLIRRRSSAAR